ncbi:hypothetical protein WR25_21628 isoform A [Diploscapter pachys]|uniref:Major facilitator superfamily (MFS) profile domain-containing protein n=3 Tax=Diploscapter pachys TaxID=2018661 RepID=A0A2A2LUB1_9BILA|nr:hypothetical protein WR25_21628 isoform A [Diploscapter pachys]
MHMLHRHRHVPSSLVMNKIDLVSDRTELLELTRILTNGTVGDARIKTAATTIGRLGANTNVEMPLHNEGIENQDERWQTRYRDLISKPTHKVNYMDTKRLFINVRGWPHFQAVFFVSSLTGEGVEPLRDYLKKISEEGEWRTGSQEVTTRDPKDICCDSIRAAMLDTVYGEVPYLAKIKINEWIEEGEVLQVVAEVHLDKDRDAKHLMGPGGHRMAQIGERVNQHLHTLFRRQLFVEMAPKPDEDEKKVKVQIQLKDIGAAKDLTNGDADLEPMQLKVYPRRWLMLIVVALLNNSNSMSWIGFASVSPFCNLFYGKSSASWFSMIFMAVTIPVGLLAMVLGNLFGLRSSMLIAGWTNGVGALIRLLSSAPFIPEHLRFPIGIAGQAIAACAYPFIMFMPTKVAGSWFPETQRALATTIGVMSNPLGVLMANVISPQLVTQASHIPLLNLFTAIPCVTAMLLVTFGVTRSEPKIPPSYSAAKPQMDFLPGLMSCMRNKQYLILFVVLGGGIGMFNCLYSIITELLCPSGYGNKFAGLCAALMIIGGVVGAFTSGIVVDRTKLYEEILKIAMGLAVVFGLIFLQLSLHDGLSIFIVVACFLFGVFGLASYPVGLELASECTYPVSEATSTSLVVLCGQVQSILLMLVMKIMVRPLQPSKASIEVCRVGKEDQQNTPYDNTISVMVFSVIASLLVLGLVIFFKPVYRRLEAERSNRAREEKAKATDETTQPLQELST